jgi:hypothetical protein
LLFLYLLEVTETSVEEYFIVLVLLLLFLKLGALIVEYIIDVSLMNSPVKSIYLSLVKGDINLSLVTGDQFGSLGKFVSTADTDKLKLFEVSSEDKSGF